MVLDLSMSFAKAAVACEAAAHGTVWSAMETCRVSFREAFNPVSTGLFDPPQLVLIMITY